MRSLAVVVSTLVVSGSVALACTYATSVWEPSSDADPPYYLVLDGRNERWIDRSGRRIPFQPQPPASDPDRLVSFQKTDFFGFSRRGETIIAPRFLDAADFHEGRARVVLDGPCVPAGSGMCGGPVLLPRTAVPSSVAPLDIQSGRWRPAAPACRYTFIDESGQVAGSNAFAEAGSFREGLAPVRVKDLWGYADKHLSVVIAPQFRYAAGFSEGVARVLRDQGFSYIDRTGAVLIRGPFDSAGEFHEGVAVVYLNDSAYYIDNAGRRAVPGTYAHAGRFFHGRANVKFRNGSYAYIDRAAQCIDGSADASASRVMIVYNCR